METPTRYNVLGVGVHALHLAQARDWLISAARAQCGGYVCLCDVNSVCSARRDPAHGLALNRSLLTTPDGMPLVWLGRLAGHRTVNRVYGPDLMRALCAATAGTELTHFFYGAGPGTADALAAQLTAQFPGLRVVGTHTPPFRELTVPEADALETQLRNLRPDFIWIGLSTPKQEKFMAQFSPRLPGSILLGVGAAFDFLSGRVRQAPRWIQRSGFEWLFRLCTEPRRLAPRYFKNNPAFVVRVLAQLCRLKKYALFK